MPISYLVQQIQGLLLNHKVVVLQTVKHSLLMTSDRFVIDVYNLDQLLQRHVAHIVFFVRQELSQDVDPEHS